MFLKALYTADLVKIFNNRGLEIRDLERIRI